MERMAYWRQRVTIWQDGAFVHLSQMLVLTLCRPHLTPGTTVDLPFLGSVQSVAVPIDPTRPQWATASSPTSVPTVRPALSPTLSQTDILSSDSNIPSADSPLHIHPLQSHLLKTDPPLGTRSPRRANPHLEQGPTSRQRARDMASRARKTSLSSHLAS